MLFRNLGISSDEKKMEISKAVCTAGFLATGNPELHESSLVLPKILCGLKPSHPVNCKRFIVDENILHQVHELISSAIEYWSVLKNTSIEGLRESFLLREGKIIEKNNDWFLIVERRPYDMLLQQLPWNISMIKLPWMSNTIITEWVY
jgi:hypothetical protein